MIRSGYISLVNSSPGENAFVISFKLASERISAMAPNSFGERL